MDLKERIMYEFISQFQEKNCKDITVDDIARNLGISKRTLYETFSSKTEIVEESLCYFLKKHGEEALEKSSQSANCMEKLIKIFFYTATNANKISMQKITELHRLYPNMLSELIRLRNEVATKNIYKLLDQCKKEGYIMDIADTDILFNLLMRTDFVDEKTMDFIMNMVSDTGFKYDPLIMMNYQLFVSLRGVSTEKGMRVCNDCYEKMSAKGAMKMNYYTK